MSKRKLNFGLDVYEIVGLKDNVCSLSINSAIVLLYVVLLKVAMPWINKLAVWVVKAALIELE